jgi:hypothetical protein
MYSDRKCYNNNGTTILISAKGILDTLSAYTSDPAFTRHMCEYRMRGYRDGTNVAQVSKRAFVIAIKGLLLLMAPREIRDTTRNYMRARLPAARYNTRTICTYTHTYICIYTFTVYMYIYYTP